MLSKDVLHQNVKLSLDVLAQGPADRHVVADGRGQLATAMTMYRGPGGAVAP